MGNEQIGADTPAPIATPEEVAERIADAHIRRLGTPRSASLRDDIAAAIAAERSTSNAEIERLTRERDAAQERGSKMMWQVQAAEARVATLTAEVGRMREALEPFAKLADDDPDRAAFDEECEAWGAMCGQPVVYTPEPTRWMPLPDDTDAAP